MKPASKKHSQLALSLALCLAAVLMACGGISISIDSGATPTAPYAADGLATRAPATPATSDGLETRSPTDSSSTSGGLSTRPPSTSAAKIATATQTRTVSTSNATPTAATINGFETIALSALPPEAQETLRLIQQGGPFPYRQDGQVFQNREGVLPKKKAGYYREYTVDTPGSSDRGARRIIVGGVGDFYYTDDHYSSFKVILINE